MSFSLFIITFLLTKCNVNRKVIVLDKLSKAIYFMDDFALFKEVQIDKYTTERKSKLNPESPEFDMIMDLIKDYWCDLLATGYINNKNRKEKESIFSSINIIFPYAAVPSQWSDGITYVDFASYFL